MQKIPDFHPRNGAPHPPSVGRRQRLLAALVVWGLVTPPAFAAEPAFEAVPDGDSPARFVEEITVVSASRHRERLVDAPAAVTVVTAGEIERRAANAQVPKLLAATPGLELTQAGLYDFNVNTRGFNGPLTRRIAVLVDGRDPSVPFLGAQEWGTFSLPLDDVESLELMRGPSAALYGSNASSGVLNLVTKPPRASAGGTLRLTAGELATANLDLRWAGELGGSWWKLLASYRSSETFAVSRRRAAEYAVPCAPPATTVRCLPQEAADPSDEVEGWAGSLRFDKNFSERLALTFEAGDSSVEGVSGPGRGRASPIPAGTFRRPTAGATLRSRSASAPGSISFSTASAGLSRRRATGASAIACG